MEFDNTLFRRLLLILTEYFVVSGADDRCEPQPIPLVLTGRESEWVTLAPFAINFWEKLVLEPYSYTKDIAYVVVAPDNDFILSRVRTFFKELSSIYEVLQLLNYKSEFLES